MNYDEAVEKVKREVPECAEADDFTLWVSFEDKHEIEDTRDMMRGDLDIGVIGDHHIDEPQVLPKSVDDCRENMVLRDPPGQFVEELTEMEMSDLSGGTVLIEDSFYYNVEKITYRWHLARIEQSMNIPRFENVLKRAFVEGWDVRLEDGNVMVMEYQPEPYTEYTSTRAAMTVNQDVELGDYSIDEMIEMLDIKKKIVQTAIDAIGEDKTQEITVAVERVQDTPGHPPLVEESGPDPEPTSIDTETEDVVVGEMVISVGGMFMAHDVTS